MRRLELHCVPFDRTPASVGRDLRRTVDLDLEKDLDEIGARRRQALGKAAVEAVHVGDAGPRHAEALGERPSTQRVPSTRSSAATKCISDVPGLAKHTSTPPPTSVRTRLSAPFILSLRSASSASCKFLPCLSGCYPSTLSIECANWEISAAPALPLDRQRERAKLLMGDFDLDVVGGADGFELRSEVCGDEDENLVFFQAGMM